ncbi:MAG: hypothetical protein KF787_11290 [Phycisphaeraceae bacterium]|nr:hypothetical protein [Phycisphaerae bacterium]MBX3393220.1 hypothetical protein [Phycisphaeraceae bacterium]
MSNAVSWIKGHLAVVSCSVVILVAVPVAWYFSSNWNKQIRQKQENAAKDKFNAVESASRVTYRLPRLSADEPAVEVTSAPNSTLTEWFKAHREKIIAQAQGIVREAERMNRRGHVPLVEGLFPDAAGQAAQVKALELAEKIVYTGAPTSAYPMLLRKIGAGTPPEPSSVATIVADERAKMEEQITAGTRRELTPDERDRVSKALVERRLAEYRARASEISVYATMEVFPAGGRGLGSDVPRVMPAQPPALDECFMWQFDYWVVSDVLDAIALANTDPDGRPSPVDRSVAKRLERIETSDQWVMAFAARGSDSMGESVGTVDSGSPDALIEPKFSRSITGRWSGPGNAVYDVRNVAVTLVASSARLPELMDAFARTNFMTVTDLDLSEVDVWADLEQGYFYGSEHVIRAKFIVETIWLRSWTQPLMPARVRGYLGISSENQGRD